MTSFATLADVLELSGKTYTSAEQERIEALLLSLSDALRIEALKVGKSIDTMIAEDESGAYANVVKLVIVDAVMRVMRQSLDGEPMAQESQSAGGFTWSGTYAIPGGGIASSLLRNDLKRLGLRRQTIGTIDFAIGYE